MAKKEQRFENHPIIPFRIYKICQNLKMVNRKQKKKLNTGFKAQESSS